MQEPELRPVPGSHAVQVDPSLQVVQLEGQEVQEEAPAREKVPFAQSAQGLVPSENLLARHWVQAPELRPNPESQAVQVEASVQFKQSLEHEVHVADPAMENVAEAQAAHAAVPPAENSLA